MQIRQIFKKQIARGVLNRYFSCAITFAHHPSPLLLGFPMSVYDQLSAAGIPPPAPPQSISNVLSPGIVSLFIQGLETGLVFSQFAQWLSLERKEGITITVLVLFVTTVGLSVPFVSPSF